MIKSIVSGAAGIILALFVSFFSHSEGIQNLIFRLGMYDASMDKKAIEETLNLFNKHFATFFNTGGNLTGLNEFPAENMIKRRIFQEINKWTKNNQLIVYDKDVFEIESVDFLDPDRAIVVAQEVWFLSIQEKKSRKPLSAVKASPLRIRYFMKKTDGSWSVVEYEVFADTDKISPMRMERF
jgi:hypothetical protein